MLGFGETKLTKKGFMLQKNLKKNWDVNFDNIVFSKLVKTKTNSKHLIGYLDKAVTPLILIMPKMSGYVKTFKIKDRDQCKNIKLMYFRIDDEEVLKKYKGILTKIEYLRINELNALPVYDDRYIKTK